MFIVYVIRSIPCPGKHYVGFTTDLEKRLKAHNAKASMFSKRYAPWELECFIQFREESQAGAFERYLKKGSGHAFLKKHLV